MVAVLIGLIFLNQPMTQVGVMNINGAIFLFLTNMTFQNVFAVINVSFLHFLLNILHLFYQLTPSLTGLYFRTPGIYA